ncbi:Tensin [Dirofilaria immitis]
MKKTEKHVKFELPHNSNNTSKIYQSKIKIDSSSLLSDARIFSYIDSKTSEKIPPISSSLQRKVRSDIRSIISVNYKPSLSIAKFPSSIITRPKRTVFSTTDKINSYLTKSKISATTFPLNDMIKPSMNYYSRISYVNAPPPPISRSNRISLQLTNCHSSAYSHAKIPPIDKTRKFCTIDPERCRNFFTTNGTMRLPTINTNVNEFDRYPNTKMEMLRSNIPWSKILSITPPDSAFSDSTISYGSRLAWKPEMLTTETSAPSSSNHAALAKMEMNSPQTMKLQYVTERIIAVLFPSDSTDAQYRTNLKDVTTLLRRNHLDHYKIFNLSKKRSDLGRLHSVVELGWPEELAPPLDRLCSICKLLENWLSANAQNVVVIHCKGGCSRAAIVIAAYMHYISICSTNKIIENCFALEQFSDHYLGSNGQPSHKRYVKYFSSLLCGRTKIQPATVYLHDIILTNFFGRNVLFKIYERMQPVYTTSLKVVAENNIFELNDLPLRGDILVKCFQRTSTAERVPFFRCQFNTCTFDLSDRNGNIYKLRFYREELDNIFNDSEVNSQAVIEFTFLIEMSKSNNDNDDNRSDRVITANGAVDGSVRRSIAEDSRADSYENFDKEEDRSELSATDAVNSVEYVEIHRPTDSTDSGLGSDSANTSKEKSGMPPLPPPKPRINLDERMSSATTDHYSEQTRGNDQVITRAHSALPASVRPNLAVRPASPIDEQRITTPRAIEPDLVAKDRYDPASKCFSYVPARALSEHFTAPRKPQRLMIEETATAALNVEPSASEIAMIPVKSTDLQRLPETPKWEDDIEKISNGIFFGENSKTTNMNATPIDFNRIGNGPIANSTPKTESSKSDYPIVEQAKHVSKRRKTKYGSYKTLNDDVYNSDLDDLCDPDFYLTYKSQATTPIASNAMESSKMSSSDWNRKMKNEARGQSAKQNYSTNNIAATATAATKLNEPNLKSTELSRNKNTTYHHESYGNRLFAHNRYDSLTDAENADDWLKFQLKKLKAKRENNPEALRRKRQEKLLLEELKHVNDNRQTAREHDERTYSLEGYGQSIDPLTEYRAEEERLQNVRTPYNDNNDQIADDSVNNSIQKTEFINSSALPPKPSDIVKHKPPTPPLRPRSQSPSASPYSRRYRIRTPFQETAYQRERNHINRSDSIENNIGDFDDSEFSHLKNIIKENNIANNSAHVELNSSTSSMKSILKKRDTQNGTSSPRINRSGSNSTEDWSSAPSSNQRAATPGFPVRRETPVPYHPLLFEGAKDVIPPPSQPMNNITYRSSSPRSVYYAQSHRTSISSTGM